MATTEQGSTHTSQEFLESGGEKNMLELLCITDAAVKALNKSVRSTSSTGSQGSKKSDVPVPFTTDPLVQSIHSDRSVKSSGSGHSLRSNQSGQLSGRSQRSGQSVASHCSIHSSQSQEDNVGAKPLVPLQDVSHDSGVISKTHTLSDNKVKQREITQTGSPEGTSDVSTTASDVLIQSTHEKSTHINSESGLLENISLTSKYSKTSFGVENFNSSGPQKVKISKRRLKEIKAPIDDEGLRDSASSDEKVPSSLLSEDIRSKRGSMTNSERSSESRSGKSETGSQDGEKGKKIMRENQSSKLGANDSNGSKRNDNYPKGFESDQFRVEKVRKSSEKTYDDINMATRNENNGASRQQTNVTRENVLKSDKEKSIIGANGKEEVIPGDINHFRSTPKYFVERHTPQKSQTKAPIDGNTAAIPERKNLLKDLEDSIEIVTAHAKDSSSTSSQPEIITVPERIVTVTAKDAGSPASTVSEGVTGSRVAPPLVSYHSAGHKLRDDKGAVDSEKPKSLDESDLIPPALPRQFKRMDDLDHEHQGDSINPSKTLQSRSQWFSKQATGHGLLQGAPVSGHDAPDKQKDEDIHISDFKLTDKQRMVKESFARRQGGPIRRVVQPRLVGHDSKASSTSSTGEQKTQHQLGQSNDQVLTAAAAASAAVAATQPFLKAQYEMEAKMAELVEKINELQKIGGVKTKTDRITQLEKQLTDVTEKRIEYMEKLQEQQMAIQAKLLSLTRDVSSRSQSRPVPPSPESHIYIHSNSQKPSTTTNNKAFSKTTVHRPALGGDYSERIQKYSSLDQDESMSPLHTPAPRSRAPRPTMYDTSDIDYRSRALSPKARSPKARSPKAKSPKARSPKTKTQSRSKSPYKENQDHGILHQILASTHSPPVRDVGLQAPRQPVLQESHDPPIDRLLLSIKEAFNQSNHSFSPEVKTKL